ncbi:MAG: L,D-transpeptidase [Bacteroidales bacterium]
MGIEENNSIDLRDEEIRGENNSDRHTPGNLQDEIKSFFQKIVADKKRERVLRILLASTGTIMSAIFILVFLLYLVPGLQEMTSEKVPKLTTDGLLIKDQNYKKQAGLLQRDIQRLSKKFNAFTSGLSYIVINTVDNRFFLYRNKKMIREGFCSSGSYTMLTTQSEKKWIFKTPKGKYWIQGKITSPVWRRPDWSFVEEGLPIPSGDDPSRWEYGVLGDYAMSIGDGYLIHGTLYKRFLGMPVTHGCVRLNDEDLEAIYNTLSIGSKVYIF